MWWNRFLNKWPTATRAACVPVRALERVISPAESHSAEPFRVRKTEAIAAPAIEPANGSNYRIKKDKPDPLKQCF